MNNKVIKIAFAGLLLSTMFSCKYKTSYSPQIPQIIKINKTPDNLSKEVRTYTVTLITEGEIVAMENTEFSLDGKEWQNSAEFKDIPCGKHTFYTRNKLKKSLQDQREMFFECYVEVPLPTIPQLNELLKQIADCDDQASDELRKFGKFLPIRGIDNVKNIEQLVKEACINSVTYTVESIETDESGNLTAIIICKN